MRPRRASRGALVASALLLCGCAPLDVDREAAVMDDLVARMRSEDLATRQAATAELLRRDGVSMRRLVVPRLALESALRPLGVTTTSCARVLRGRVTGGDERALELLLTDGVAPGAVLSVPLPAIKAISLAER